MSIFPWSWSDGAVSLNIYDRDLADDITVWLPLTLTPPLLFPACITTVLPADVTDCNVKVWAVMFPWWDYPCVVTVPSSTFLLTILPLSQHAVLYCTVLFCTVLYCTAHNPTIVTALLPLWSSPGLATLATTDQPSLLLSSFYPGQKYVLIKASFIKMTLLVSI